MFRTRLQQILKFFLNTFFHFSYNYGFIKAAALSYFAFLTFIPIILLFIYALGLFLQSNTLIMEWILSLLQQFTPTGFDSISRLIQATMELASSSSFIGFIGLVWSLLIFFSALEANFNQIWEVKKRRPFLISKLVGLGLMSLLMLSALLTFLITNLLMPVLKPENWSFLSKYPIFTTLPNTLIYFLQIILLLITFFLIYKIVPTIKVRTRAALGGALFATFAGELARIGYRLYIQRFPVRNLLYGSLLTAVVLLIWLNYTMIILLLGCEISHAIQKKLLAPHE
jgi:membrane protein